MKINEISSRIVLAEMFFGFLNNSFIVILLPVTSLFSIAKSTG
jgi:hypothetical protein